MFVDFHTSGECHNCQMAMYLSFPSYKVYRAQVVDISGSRIKAAINESPAAVCSASDNDYYTVFHCWIVATTETTLDFGCNGNDTGNRTYPR